MSQITLGDAARPQAPDAAPARSGEGRPRRTLVLATVLTSLAMLGLGLVAAPPAAAAPTIPAAAKAHPTLKYGSRGAAVKYVQARLGVKPRSGWYGPKTTAAVKAYERKRGLKVDGVVDKHVWRALGVPYVKPKSSSSSSTTARGAAILREAAKHKGKPYRYGAAGPSAFDCSGYVGYVVKKATGIKLPRTSAGIRAATPKISKSQVRPGDLVFVHNGGGWRVSHVAIYAGSGRWWEASRPGKPVGLNKAWTSNVSYGRVR